MITVPLLPCADRLPASTRPSNHTEAFSLPETSLPTQAPNLDNVRMRSEIVTALGIPVALAQMLGRLMRQLYRSWQNVDPHFVAQRAISPATGENMFLQAPEPSQTFEIPENLNTLKESVLSDNYGFVMDGSQELPGGQGGAVLAMGGAQRAQRLRLRVGRRGHVF